MQVDKARLDEMLAGLEGVTPGPRHVFTDTLSKATYVTDDAGNTMAFFSPMEDDDRSEGKNADQFARCDPDTIQSIITELLELRSLRSTEGKEGEAMTDAARDVLAERRRQITAEGWTSAHDDTHSNGEMAKAAGVYALAAASHDYRWVLRGSPVNDYLASVFKMWPWDWSWFKPKSKRQDYVRAAALLIAQIERDDRAALTRSPE